jgi:hypothetical protein
MSSIDDRISRMEKSQHPHVGTGKGPRERYGGTHKYGDKGDPVHTVPLFSVEQYSLMHAKFCNAMLKARDQGLEKFTVGVVTEPCTAHPKMLHAEAPAMPRGSASSDMVAD